MKTIKLTQGQYAIVDDADYEWLNQWKWYAQVTPIGFYATRMSPWEKGNRNAISMHRQILGLGYGDPRQADHANHNTLDNRRNNIRICTHQQNCKNRGVRENSVSKFKGVVWDNLKRRWRARIGLNGKNKCLGRFRVEEDAARAYDKAAKQHYGEFACFNFKEIAV